MISQQWREKIQEFAKTQKAYAMRDTTISTRIQHLEHFARRIPVAPYDVKTSQIIEYLSAQDWAYETRRGRINTLRAFYTWAYETHQILDNPTATLMRLKPMKPSPRPVPDDVYWDALTRADETERVWIDLAAEHGMRRGEIAIMRYSDIVETLLGYDLLVHGKGGKPRYIPLTHAMVHALREREKNISGRYIFPGDDDGHISPRWLGKRVNNLLDGDWTIHKLRHRAATRFWINSEDPYVVADLMGWANLTMVRTYVKLPDDRLRAVVEAASKHNSHVKI